MLASIVSGFTFLSVLGFSIPFFRSLFPARTDEYYLDIDVGKLRPGLSRKLNWLGRSVLLVARSDAQVEELSKANRKDLLDPDSKSSSQPEYARNQNRSRRPGYFLAFSNCTHLGCEVMLDASGGFNCPCHKSSFDAAGRIRRGGAAKRNLEIPEYRFITPNKIRLVYKRS